MQTLLLVFTFKSGFLQKMPRASRLHSLSGCFCYACLYTNFSQKDLWIDEWKKDCWEQRDEKREIVGWWWEECVRECNQSITHQVVGIDWLTAFNALEPAGLLPLGWCTDDLSDLLTLVAFFVIMSLTFTFPRHGIKGETEEKSNSETDL